jgi:hypothetical protein
MFDFRVGEGGFPANDIVCGPPILGPLERVAVVVSAGLLLALLLSSS